MNPRKCVGKKQKKNQQKKKQQEKTGIIGVLTIGDAAELLSPNESINYEYDNYIYVMVR